MIKEIKESEIVNIIPTYNIDLQFPEHNRGLVSLLEMNVMLRLLDSINANSLFEFGTWAGKTTRTFSLYVEKVYTIDIDKETADLSTLVKGQWGELSNHNDIGFYHKDRDNVVQFYGDSSLVDVMQNIRNTIGKQVDSCFIDANHRYEYVLSNTLQAFAMVKSGGLVIWHDVKDDSVGEMGVIKALNTFDIAVYNIEGTWIGFSVN